MAFDPKSHQLRRFAAVSAAIAALSVAALAPAFLASTFFTQPSVDSNESVQILQVDEHSDPEATETVLLRMSATHEEAVGDPSISGWNLLEDADIIKVTIEDRGVETRSDDVPTSGQLADPQWHTFDIIRNGVEIPEDFVRRGDILIFSYVHDPSMDSITTDEYECSTILRIRAEDTDGEDSEAYIGYLKVTGDDSVTMGTCAAFRIDTDPE